MPSDVAGRAAYTVRVSPQARRRAARRCPAGVGCDPRRAAAVRDLRPRQQSRRCWSSRSPTSLTAGPVLRDFDVSPPPGSKVVKIATREHDRPHARAAKGTRQAARNARPRGVAAAAAAPPVPFTLVAPPQAGRPAASIGPAARHGRQARRAGHLRGEPRRHRGDRARRQAAAARQAGPRAAASRASACRRSRSTARPAQELDTALGTRGHVHPQRSQLHGDRLGAAGGGRSCRARAVRQSSDHDGPRRSRSAGWSSATAI